MVQSANYCFEVYAYVWWRIRGAVRWGGEEEGLLYFFKKIEKSDVITRKNALIIFIHGLNVNLCSHLKRCFKSTLKEKLRNYPGGFLSCVIDECLSKCPIPRNLSCPVKFLHMVFTPDKKTWLLSHVYTAPDRFYTYPIYCG